MYICIKLSSKFTTTEFFILFTFKIIVSLKMCLAGQVLL